MWFNLAWFGIELRRGPVALPDGRVASVQRFVEQGRGFMESDIEAMLAEQMKILQNTVTLHRDLQEQGQIEVSVSPHAHPIAPLLVDTERATVDRPSASLPKPFAQRISKHRSRPPSRSIATGSGGHRAGCGQRRARWRSA